MLDGMLTLRHFGESLRRSRQTERAGVIGAEESGAACRLLQREDDIRGGLFDQPAFETAADHQQQDGELVGEKLQESDRPTMAPGQRSVLL